MAKRSIGVAAIAVRLARIGLARLLSVSEGSNAERRAALHLLSSGHVDDGLATLRTVLDAVGLPLPGGPRAAFWGLVWQRLRLRWRAP